MPEIETHITIAAPASKVWAILTDFAAMPEWNPFIPAMSGSPARGSRLQVRIAPPGKHAMTFTPTVLVAAPGRELRWIGSLVTRWLFAGEHYFLLDALTPQTTRLTQGELFTGALSPLLMRGSALAATTQGFVAMNEALKLRAERSDSVSS